MDADQQASYVPVADVEVTDVRPEAHGFVLEGRGADRADYRLEMHLDMPVDPRTRSVLGGILAQSEWRVWRRAETPLTTSRRRARRPAGGPSS